jgi:HlyD family secretion protein
MRQRVLIAVMLALTLAAADSACSRRAEPDAYGNVEATDVVVGAEAAGRLVSYDVIEGQKLAAGAVVGAIDATQLTLEREQLSAQRAAASSRIQEARQHIESLEAQRSVLVAQRDAAKAQREALVAQHEIARRSYERAQRLFNAQAATAQQLDQAEREYRVLGEQIKAQDEQVRAHERQIAAQSEQVQAARAQEQTVKSQALATEAQVGVADERIKKSQVTSPVAGTVLTTYARNGEVVQIGQPLFRVARLDVVDVRAYVTEPQLASLRLGQEVRVSVDSGRGQIKTFTGTVTWISPQAEFTPTPIQTREERADLVYAFKIRVPNPDEVLKIGMPVDVQLNIASAGR